MKIAGFDWDGGNWPKSGQRGVSGEEIERLLLEGGAILAPDLNHTVPTESRHIAAGRVDGRALFVALAFRGELIRPISVCYMHAKEVSNYEART